MQQERILQLLKEAAEPSCSEQRRNLILHELSAATAAMGDDGTYSSEDPVSGIRTAMLSLFLQTLENRPELLPSLFPAFALICGDRKEDFIIADIDWSLVK